MPLASEFNTPKLRRPQLSGPLLEETDDECRRCQRAADEAGEVVANCSATTGP
jgi:hypothetical protein